MPSILRLFGRKNENSHSALIEYFRYRITQLDPPTTPIPSPPVTNPVNPPVTNPVNPPVPVTTPSTTPTGSGQWCIAKSGTSQAALDYACGTGGADCASIQQGSSCYEPATLQNHASYAFNSYYQKNPPPKSCDFGGAAAITSTNPSTGSCVYPLSSSAAAPVTTQAPVNPTSLPTAPPTTSSSGPRAQYPPPPAVPVPGSNIGIPDPMGLGAFGANPPFANMPSTSNKPRPFIGYLLTVAFIIMFGM
ncbi:uncharacterized protein LOC143575021 [Bidens hawaiensis]|uniref:uncharacterized protein LOC143575021 n=1 Tax=Bidens hawaiensis TaxID=980011 RepID=UPI00404B6D3D